MKKKRSAARISGILSAALLLTMMPFNGLALEGSPAENRTDSQILAEETSESAVSLQQADVSAAAVSAEGYLESSQTGGTILSQSENGNLITGTVRVEDGYDLATVRYQHTDGTYDLASLTRTSEGYSFTVTKTAEGTGLIPEFFSTEVWDGAVDLSWYDSSQSEFSISTPAQAAGLAALVNGMTDRSLPVWRIKGDASLLISHQVDNYQLTGAGGGNQYATVYLGDASCDFAGKTIYLTADLDMGGVYDQASDSWSGPNWTPIGGKYPMEPSTGEYLIEAFFNGVLDGQGHSIKNLYCDRFTKKGYAYSQAVGLVGYLGDEYEGETLPQNWKPSVRNLTVDGDIYGRRMVGGIVGRTGGAGDGIIIENCANFAEVRNTDSKGVGGICGAGWGSGIIRSCYNRGNVTTTYQCPTGGICGSNGGLSIYNCYNTGTISSNGNNRGRGIGSHESGSYTVDNCYYLEGCGDDQDHPGYYSGTALNIKVDTEEVSETELKSSELVSKLNVNGEVFVKDTSGINDGYPVLYYQAKSGESQTTHTVRLEQSSGGTLSAAGDLTVPYGTVIELTAEPEGGYLFQNYTANGQEFTGSFYTVVDDVTISARFSPMKKGKISIVKGDSCTVTLQKSGTVTGDGGKAEQVSRYQVKNGDALFEGDTVTASACLSEGAEPADPSKEYTGEFRYTFQYGNGTVSTTEKGSHKVTSAIQNGTLTVKAEPLTRTKTWSSLADTSWFTGNSDTYTIQSAAQLAGMASLVNSGTDFSGVTICLSDDLSLKNCDGTGTVRQWIAIGSGSANAFKGTFDGKGHTISGMTAVSSGSYSGLFGYCTGAVIRNVTVKGSSKAQGSAAGIAAHLSGGVITDCVSRVRVTSSDQYAAGIAAGITDGAEIRHSVNYGSVSGTSSTAGIAGSSGRLTDRISDCVNYGAITGSSSQSGGTAGIAGSLGGSVVRCGNYGSVTGNGWYTGGLAGHTGSADTSSMETSVIQDSYNRGSVSSENKTKNAAAGGLVGYAQYIHMSNCYNAGSVTLSAGASSCCGSAVGRFYRSVYNQINDVSLLEGTSSQAMDVDDSVLDYVQLQWMDQSALASDDYCRTMNALAGDGYFVSGAYPELSGLQKNTLCTVRFTGDYTGVQLVYAGDDVELPENPEGTAYQFTVNGIPWDGTNVVSDQEVSVVKQSAAAKISFYADGCLVAERSVENGEKTVSEPEVPEKEGYTGSWPEYELTGSDLRIDAVYTANTVYGGTELSEDGLYYLAGNASGTVTVSSGTNVTLDGGQGAAEAQILLEKGASVVLKNIHTSYNGNVLVLKGNNTVEIQGENTLTGASTESDNKNPTILAEGAVTFSGSGLLYTDAQSGNAAVQADSSAVITIDGPKLECYKLERLGIDGGVLNGAGSVRLNSGVLACFSNSDNLYACSIGSFIQTGGTAIFITDDHEHAIRAGSIRLDGGSFRAQGRSHEDPSVYYENAEAVECSGFAGRYQLTEVSVGTAGAPYTISSGSTISEADSAYETALSEKEDSFSLIPGDKLYVWSENGSTPTVKGTDGAGYTAVLLGSTVQVRITDPLPEGAVLAAASYSENGEMIDYVSADASERASFDINLYGASVIRIFVYQSREDWTPLRPVTELAL